MPSAATASSGATSATPNAASTRSSRRLAMAVDAANGHEHLGGLHAALIAPRFGPVAQRVERAWMRIGTNLALVAGHRRELGVEGGRDVDPRVRDEAAWVRPLSAARGVERVDGPDAVFRRPRRDEGRLEQQLVIAIHVTAVLTVDDVRADLTHE